MKNKLSTLSSHYNKPPIRRETASQTSLDESHVLVLSVMAAHGKCSDSDLRRLVTAVEQKAAFLVLEEMFPNNSVTKEALIERGEEFDTKLIEKYHSYARKEWTLETQSPKPLTLPALENL